MSDLSTACEILGWGCVLEEDPPFQCDVSSSSRNGVVTFVATHPELLETLNRTRIVACLACIVHELASLPSSST